MTGAQSTRSAARSAIALGLSILVFLPLFPAMPSAGPDPSWRMALNELWARGFDFGGVAFTYGPYAFLSTGQYHPDTYGALVACSVFLGAVLLLLLRYVELGATRTVYVVFILVCLIVSAYTSSPDVRFVCYGFLFLAAVARPPRSGADAAHGSLLLGAPVVLSLAAFSLGLICLVKATYAVEAAMMVALGVVVLCVTDRRLLASAIVISFVVGLILFWLAAGQSVAELPRFFLNQAQVVAGYGQAMSRGQELLPAALFLISVMPLAIAIERDLQPPTAGKCALAVGMAFALFVSFKEGFVREDDWHVLTAAEALFVLPWCWPFDRVDLWRYLQAAAAAGTVVVFIVQFPHPLHPEVQAAAFEQLLHCSDRGPVVCPIRSDWLRQSYDLSLARLAEQVPVPKLQGTVDVYTVSQYLAIANGYRWDPRPALQSYNAYTPALARMDAEHLTGAAAPDGVLLALDTIDARLPALEDGASWPILLSRYSVKWLGDRRQPQGQTVAYLAHKPDSARIDVVRIPLFERSVALEQRVALPQTGQVLFATIDIRPDTYGRFEGVLFKDPALYINFRFPNGETGLYRLIPGMARAGFVISPVVVDTEQFVTLQDLEVRKALANRRPVEFWLSGAQGASLVWSHAATVEISSLREARN